jgi:hypothetical protein
MTLTTTSTRNKPEVQRHRRDAEVADRDRLGQRPAEDRHRIDAIEPARSVGDVDRVLQVVQEHADDLAEAQRDDGEVVAAQPEHRKAEQAAGDRREQRGQRHHDPDRRVQPVRKERGHGGEGLEQVRAREQRVHVRAHRVERDEAEVEQAGVADHDVQPERQQHVQQRERHDAHPALAELLHDEGQGRQRDRADDEQGDALGPFHVRLPVRRGRPRARRAGPAAAA